MKKIYTLILLVCFSLLCGCGAEKSTSPSKKSDYWEYKKEERNEKIKTSVEEDNKKQEEIREQAGVTQENVEKIKEMQDTGYAYNVMDPKYRDLYSEIYIILCNEAEDVKITTTDAKEIEYVFSCVLNDHPEIYWVEGYQYVNHEMAGNVSYQTFSGLYIYTIEERRHFQIDINNYLSQCLAGLKHGADDYEKVKYVYEYVINNTDYEVGCKDNQNILSVMKYGKSVCQGYAKTVQYLLNKMGVECCMVTGSASGEGHAWNLVKIDGAYYYVDATWGDASYIVNNSRSNVDLEINYDYLNITTDQISKDHEFKNVVTLPACISTDANYYVREGLYFYWYDEDLVASAFQRAYDNKLNVVTFKCANQQVFEVFTQELLTNQKIFDFITNADTVSYTSNDKTLSLNFWL